MIFVKILLGFLLYLAIGIGLVVLMCRLDESFDNEIYDTMSIFMASLFWPILLIIYGFKIFTEKVAKFFSNFIDRIEAIKEEREMEEDDE